MSITRNRELSQFGSFIHIDDITQNIGITSLSTPFVGIGTTNPGFKLDVNGDINLTGTFRQNGNAFEGSRFTVGTGSSIYRLQGNVGIGTSVTPQKLTVLGNVSAGQFISTFTSGTAPLVVLSDTQVTNLNASFLRGKLPPTGDIVGTTDTQTLTNKILTSPTINTAIIGSAGITFNGTSGTTTLKASATASGTLTLPAATDTLVGKDTSDTLTNKSIAASSNTITGLTNTNLSGSAGISNANLANATISGVALGSNLNVLTFTDYLISGGTYNGSTARTVSVAGTSINTGNTLVARDISGDFTAGTVTLSGLTLSGALVLSSTTESTDKDTGCLILQGGIGVEKNANIGGGLNVNVGSASTVVINYGNSQIISAPSSNNPGSSFTNNSVGNNNSFTFTGARNNIFGSFNDGTYTGNNNTIIGHSNGTNMSGSSNKIFGISCGGGSGDYNILIGDYNNYGGGSSGDYNILIGDFNNYGGNSSGSYNTLIGYQIFYQNSFAGNYNVVMGFNAAYTTTNIGVNASDNVIFGRNAAGFGSITSASNNVAIGQSALNLISTGNRNVALGSSAGIGITTGNENVVIGFKQTTPILSGSNQLVIGAGNTAWINGNSSYNVGIGTTNATSKLHVVGDARVGSGPTEGVILTSTNGTKYRLIVSDAGVLSTTVVT